MNITLLFRDGIISLIILACIVMILYYAKRNEGNKINFRNCIGILIFEFIISAIMNVTGITPMSGFHSDLQLESINWNIIKAIKEMIDMNDIFGYVNVFGNVILFMPIGFCFPILCRKCLL